VGCLEGVQRQQGGADVAQPGEHAVELGLVCDRYGQRRGAIVVPGDGEVAQRAAGDNGAAVVVRVED